MRRSLCAALAALAVLLAWPAFAQEADTEEETKAEEQSEEPDDEAPQCFMAVWHGPRTSGGGAASSLRLRG